MNLFPFPAYNDIFCSKSCSDLYNDRLKLCSECKNSILGKYIMCDNDCGYRVCDRCKIRKHKCQ